MADISGLVMTVLDLSFNLASTLYTYAKDVRGARGDIQQLNNEPFALIGVLQHLNMQQESQAFGKPAANVVVEVSNQPIVQEILQECVEFLQELHQKSMIPKSRFQAKFKKNEVAFSQ